MPRPPAAGPWLPTKTSSRDQLGDCPRSAFRWRGLLVEATGVLISLPIYDRCGYVTARDLFTVIERVRGPGVALSKRGD